MGAPGGPAFGAGIGQAQAQQDKSPAEVAVGTVEKLLLGIQDEAFRPYALQAIAKLKGGLAMMQQKQPQSAGMGQPPAPGQGAPAQVPAPPTPGQMPG